MSASYDIYHQTHYNNYALPFLPKNVKMVTTIHDLNYFVIPESYPSYLPYKEAQIKAIKRADHIITISENSKKDLIHFFQVPENKISVIYHGVDAQRFRTPQPNDIKEEYILFVGARYESKNFTKFIKAFSLLSERYPDLKLYCTGSDPSEDEIKLLEHYNLTHKVKFKACSDEELIALYQGARLFVYPSLYEGFGLPILEAMASGCPALISDKSCFPEIASDAAAYFDPYDVDSIFEAMNNVLSDNSYRSSLIGRGLERVKLFTWDKSAQEHRKVYQSLV